MNVKYFSIILAVGLVFFAASEYLSADPVPGQIYLKDGKLPRTFRISPVKTSEYAPFKVLYNPVEDLYVAFVMEWDYKGGQVKVFSRVYNHKGRPKGPFMQVLPLLYRYGDSAVSKNFVVWADVCYNSMDNKFLIIWTYQDMDMIYGTELNERGNKEGVSFNLHFMKKQLNQRGSGMFPQIDWQEDKEQYVMGWTYISFDSSNPNNPKNGYYLSTFTPFLTPKKNMKKVKSMRIINRPNLLTSFFAAGDKLLWATTEEIDDTWTRSAFWLTKSNGKNLSPDFTSDAGTKYPGKKFKYGGKVSAGYNPDDDLFLLKWGISDAEYEYKNNSLEIHYRIMDSKGNFIGKEQKLSQVENYLTDGRVTYDQNDGHFLITCAEYKVLDDDSLFSISQLPDNKYRWGGRIWGYQIDNQGKQIGSRIPLTKVFTDAEISLYFDGVTYNAYDDQHFIIYDLGNYVKHTSKAFGLIYK